MVQAVSYLPWRGSAAHIMFFASNICWVNSGTVSARYCWDPLEVKGANPTMKKCRRGKGIRLTAIFLKSLFNCPGNLMQQVTPDIAAETKWFKSPYVGVVSFKVLKQMSYRASLSMTWTSSAFSTNWCTDRVAL